MKKDKSLHTVLRTEERKSDGRFYKYELLVRESGRVASYKMPLYSISVTLTDTDGKTTRKEVNEAFADVGKAIVFFDKLVRNLATPIDLIYVAEDEFTKISI